MIRTLFVLFISVLYLTVITACGTPATVTPTAILAATATPQEPDPCSAENLPATVEKVNQLMSEFESASARAANLPVDQLPELISDMQRIRRDAQDVQIPPCLETLKTHQLTYMNLMIQTLIAFVGGSEQAVVRNGLDQARQEHNLYSIEIARLLGITLAAVTATPPASGSTP